MYERPLTTSADGSVEGFRMVKEDNFKGLNDELSYTISLDEQYDRIRLDLEMTPEAYATTTDIGVAVETSDGEAIYNDGFSYRTVRATVPTDGGRLTEGRHPRRVCGRRRQTRDADHGQDRSAAG